MLNAATMLGQSKTVFQSEIDIAELADFLRFGVWSAQEIFKDQPASTDGIWNRQDYQFTIIPPRVIPWPLIFPKLPRRMSLNNFRFHPFFVPTPRLNTRSPLCRIQL